VNRSLTLALTLIAVAATSAAWWQYAWKPAMVDTVPRNEPLALSAMEHVRRVLFEPTAMFNGVRYFEASQAACGEVTWQASSTQAGGHTFFVAYPGGFVRLARDMAPEDFLTLVKRDCPDRRVERAATEVVYQSQQPASKPKAP
jgi:hypothetical protein